LEITKSLIFQKIFQSNTNIQENTVKFMTMLTLLKTADNEIKVAVAADILS
jgi:hypothetical protein